MKKIGLIADSSASLANAPFDHKIKVAKSTIHFKDQILLDGVDITTDEFFKQLEETIEIPTTAAPSTGEIVEQIEAHKLDGKDAILYFPISTGLSAYGKNLKSVIDMLDLGIEFHVFDAKTACLMQGLVVKYAELLLDKGFTLDEVIDSCEFMIKQIHSYFVVDDLKYLIRNGRLSKITGTIGALASIKPVLELNHEGIIVPYEKVRTHKKAIHRIEEIIEDASKKYKEKIFMVLHTNRLELAEEVKMGIQEGFAKDETVIVSSIVSTVGAHIGSGVIGIVCIGLDGLKIDLKKVIKS